MYRHAVKFTLELDEFFSNAMMGKNAIEKKDWWEVKSAVYRMKESLARLEAMQMIHRRLATILESEIWSNEWAIKCREEAKAKEEVDNGQI